MTAALEDLATPDSEHPDTWLTDDDGWTVSAFEGGTVYLLDPDGTPVFECRYPSQHFVLELWLLLQAGKRAAITERIVGGPDGGPARPFPQPSKEQLRETEQAFLAVDRAFYDSLGPEQSHSSCRTTGCERGPVQFSVFCRVHHFQSIKGRPCPFNH
jgi:hypothetical protein